MKDFEVTVKLRNNQLKARRVALGMSAVALSREAGVTYLSYCNLESLKDPPVYPRDSVRGIKQGTWRPAALKVAKFYGCPPEDLFPDTIRYVQQTEIVATFDLEQLPLAALKQVPALLPSPEDVLLQGEAEAQLNSVLDVLPPKQRTVIEYRFGLNGREVLTLEGTGEILDLSRERVRQIERQALTKLRRHARKDGTFIPATPRQENKHAPKLLEKAATLIERAESQRSQAEEAERRSRSVSSTHYRAHFRKRHDELIEYAERNEAKARKLRALAEESPNPAQTDPPNAETRT